MYEGQLHEVVSTLIGSEEFQNQLRESIEKATVGLRTPPQTPVESNVTSVTQEIRRLFPSINRTASTSTVTTQNQALALPSTIPCHFPSQTKKRRKLNERQNIFKKEVVLLDHPEAKRTLTGAKKVSAFENGFAYFSVEFDKYWTEQKVMSCLSELFKEKLKEADFEILVPMHGALIQPRGSRSLDGVTIYNLFHQKIIYLRPLIPILEDVIVTEQVIPERNYSLSSLDPQNTSTETKDFITLNSEHQFQQDLQLAIEASKGEMQMPISFLQLLEELKNNIDSENVSYFNVYREDIFNCCMRAVSRPNFSTFKKVSVTFTDIVDKSEGAVDLGGPTREMFTLVMQYLKNSKSFEGPEYSRNVSLCNSALEKEQYFYAGRLIMLSLIYGGPSPNFLSTTLYSCLVHGVENTQPNLTEITNEDVRAELANMQNFTNLDDLQKAVEQSQLATLANYTYVQNFNEKEEIINGIIKFYVIHRVRSAIDQFEKGLNTDNLLDKMKQFPSDLKAVFCYSENELTAQAMRTLFKPVLSESGTNQRLTENEVLSFWLDYLLDSEADPTNTSLKKILRFSTGVEMMPPLGFDRQHELQFLHDDASLFPKANTCALILSLPVVHKNYESFVFSMNYGFQNGLAFGYA